MRADNRRPHGDNYRPRALSRRVRCDNRRPHGDNWRPRALSRRVRCDNRRAPGDNLRLRLIVNVIDSNAMSWHAGRMAGPLDAIRHFDRLVHDPSRLVILTALDACGGSEFMPLQFLTGLSRGNLSLHLGKLL